MSPVERVLACAIVVPFVIGFSSADAGPAGAEVCRFQDPQIVESSGLVVRDGLMATVNDSGDSGRVFVVDAKSCRTVGTTSWSEEARDVEAVAPASGGDVLVGDIGDNLAARDSVQLLRVPVGRQEETVTPTTYEITYPGGSRDAEALLVHPVSGQVLIASKGLMSGILYAAPETLSEDDANRMTELADVPGMVTDGAFFPDGRHFVLRTYSRAVFYTYPGLEAVGDVDLPEQQQGEGIAVDERDRVHLSSEGLEAPVLRLDLPKVLRERLDPPAPEAGAEPDAEGDERPGHSATSGEQAPVVEGERDAWPWLVGGAFGVVMIVVLLRALRPR